MSIIKELQTIRDFVRYAMSQFCEAQLHYGHGTDNPKDEACYLIVEALHLPHEYVDAVLDARLLIDERRHLLKLIEQRISSRLPSAYLVNTAWFAGLRFYVDQRVLIPRSPLAHLITAQLQPWLRPEDVHYVLEIGTGSACIAIAIAMYLPHVQVHATEVDDDAMAVAQHNVVMHGVEDKVKLYQADLFPEHQMLYDLIITNPPYVTTTEMDKLPAEYLHEPALGLHAGDDGLDFVRRILVHAPQYLTPDGVLIVEVGNSRAAVVATYPDLPLVWLDLEDNEEESGVFMLKASEVANWPTS